MTILNQLKENMKSMEKIIPTLSINDEICKGIYERAKEGLKDIKEEYKMQKELQHYRDMIRDLSKNDEKIEELETSLKRDTVSVYEDVRVLLEEKIELIKNDNERIYDVVIPTENDFAKESIDIDLVLDVIVKNEEGKEEIKKFTISEMGGEDTCWLSYLENTLYALKYNAKDTYDRGDEQLAILGLSVMKAFNDFLDVNNPLQELRDEKDIVFDYLYDLLDEYDEEFLGISNYRFEKNGKKVRLYTFLSSKSELIHIFR